MYEEVTGSVNDGTINEEPKNKYKLSGGNEEENNSPAEEKVVTNLPDSGMNIKEPAPEEPLENSFFYASRMEQPQYDQSPEDFEPIVIKNKGFRFNPIIIITGVALIIMLMLIIKDVTHKDPAEMNGEYQFSYVECDGRSMGTMELLAWGTDTRSMSIIIDDDTATVCVDGSSVDCDLLVDGDEITISGTNKQGEVKEMEGSIDLYDETVTIDVGEGHVVFEKI